MRINHAEVSWFHNANIYIYVFDYHVIYELRIMQPEFARYSLQTISQTRLVILAVYGKSS